MAQILEPLRAMTTSFSLEDARHLAQRYSRMRQEAETQVIKHLGCRSCILESYCHLKL